MKKSSCKVELRFRIIRHSFTKGNGIIGSEPRSGLGAAAVAVAVAPPAAAVAIGFAPRFPNVAPIVLGAEEVLRSPPNPVKLTGALVVVAMAAPAAPNIPVALATGCDAVAAVAAGGAENKPLPGTYRFNHFKC